MPITIEVQTKVLSGRDGSKDNPFVSGGILFEAAVTGAIGGIKLVWQHRWVIGGMPIEEHRNTPEMWYGRDGMGLTPHFAPTKKTTLSMVRIEVWQLDHRDENVFLDRWVMAAENEPKPTWWIQCRDGRVEVDADQLKFLREKGLISSDPPHLIFDGTVAQLKQILNPDPPPPPPPPPTDEYRLQICYAPLHGREYDVHKDTYTDPEADIKDMAELGAWGVNLWFSPAHLFWNTQSFQHLHDPIRRYYEDFLEACSKHGLKVVGKLSMWSIPGWFDQQGTPALSFDRYQRHLEAKAQMARTINNILPTQYMILCNEPQLELWIYPSQPGNRVRHDPATCLEITKDVINTLAPEFTCKKIGPAMAGAIKSITDTYIRPVDFLKGLKPTLVANEVNWCGVNAYPLVNSSPPSYTNYGQHYKEMADVYPLWPSECGVARKNVPGDALITKHLTALIDQVEGFSPGLYSHFIYRDFNADGWGLQTLDDKPDIRRKVLLDKFGEEPPAPEQFTYYLELRTAKEMDTGIYIVAKKKAHVKIVFFKQHEDAAEDGIVQDIKHLTLGGCNPRTKRVKADWHTEADLAVVTSDVPVACASAWPSKFAEELYTIFPGLELSPYSCRLQ